MITDEKVRQEGEKREIQVCVFTIFRISHLAGAVNTLQFTCGTINNT